MFIIKNSCQKENVKKCHVKGTSGVWSIILNNFCQWVKLIKKLVNKLYLVRGNDFGTFIKNIKN